MNDMKIKKSKFLFSLLFFILILSGCEKKDKFIDSVKQQAKNLGLKDISVTAEKDEESGLYCGTLKSSNFNKLTPEEMLEIADSMEKNTDGGVILYYVCGDDEYYISVDDKTIDKNDDYGWYDDYENSTRHDLEASNNSAKNARVQDVDDDNERVECWTLATQAVKDQLKLPSSAKFPFSASSNGVSIIKNSSGDTYYVSAWVEAKNSFGGTVRSDFCVSLSHDESGFSVTTVDVDE